MNIIRTLTRRLLGPTIILTNSGSANPFRPRRSCFCGCGFCAHGDCGRCRYGAH